MVVFVANIDNLGHYSVSAFLPDPKIGVSWLEQYISLAGRLAKERVLSEAQGEVDVKIQALEQDVKMLRESAHKRREDKIARLQEALVIAKSIGMEKPATIASGGGREAVVAADDSLSYMRGRKALEAELASLRSRASDEPFISGLRNREEVLDFYRGLRIDSSKVEVYREDGGILVPERPVRPRRALIVLVGIAAGLVLGVILALLCESMQSPARRELPR